MARSCQRDPHVSRGDFRGCPICHGCVTFVSVARVHQLLRWANKREVARELTRRGYDVSGETLNRWVREEKEIPSVVERMVLELYGIPDTTKQPPPEWARAVAEESADAVVRRLVPPELLGAAHRLLADLARLEPPSDEADDAMLEGQDQVG